MADKKISALPAATTPLAGTEVLPVVQGGTTDQVSVANLTAGRAVSTLSVSTTSGYQLRGAENTSYELLRVVDGTVNPGVFIKARAATKDAYLFASGSSVAGQRLMIGAEAVEDVIRVSKDNVTVSYGNLIVGTAGKGIDFSANTHAPGMTSELLNWYEEGDWTPTQGAGLTVVGSYSSFGKYTRIGKQVTVVGEILGSTSVAVSSGGVLCAGLPFATPGGSAAVFAGGLSNASVNATSLVIGSGTTLYASAAIAATTRLYFSATYLTA